MLDLTNDVEADWVQVAFKGCFSPILRLYSNPGIRIHFGMKISENVETFTFLQVRFSILCCDNTVLTVWSGVRTKPTWLRFGKDHVTGLKYHNLCLQIWLEMSQSLKNIQWLHAYKC